MPPALPALPTPSTVAVKMLMDKGRRGDQGVKGRGRLLRNAIELAVLTTLSHPNFVQVNPKPQNP